jgi:hypothetical protein
MGEERNALKKKKKKKKVGHEQLRVRLLLLLPFVFGGVLFFLFCFFSAFKNRKTIYSVGMWNPLDFVGGWFVFFWFLVLVV